MQEATQFPKSKRTANTLKAAIAAVTFTIAGAAIAEPDTMAQKDPMTGNMTGNMTGDKTGKTATGDTMTGETTGDTTAKTATSGTDQAGMQFDQLDTNGNGYLDREEFSAVAGVTGSEGATTVDTDQDGKISRTEFAAFETGRTGDSMSGEQMPEHQAMDPAERSEHSTTYDEQPSTYDEQPSVDPGP